ncbi:MAG: hypothetical protein JJE39_09100 [Vicinamibacteria bacterium]|nr:hypothetical protein [Vicinamibacteria bacterium]
MAPFQSAARTLLTLAFWTPTIDAQEMNRNRVRYELTRATVLFTAGSFSPEEMGRFALLADRGVADIDTLLNHPGPGPTLGPPITFVVRDRLSISRTVRRTILLPADRVRRDAAPYLHEATHILVPMNQECLWLSEGFASYVQSYVAENIGGYDGYVFSWGGNRNIDRLARRTLNSDHGRTALPYVGAFDEPPDLFEKRREVAQPLYILAHSLVKFMVDRTSLEKVTTLVQSSDIAGSAERLTGKTIDAWKALWLNMVNQPRAEVAATQKRDGSDPDGPAW